MDNKKLGNTGRRGIKNKIIELRKNGKSVRDISKELKCSKATINYHLEKQSLLDIGLKPQVITDDIKQEIYNYTKTNTIADAVKFFNIGRTAIVRYSYKKDLTTSPELKADIVEYRKTHTSKETAEQFNLSVASVNRFYRASKIN